MEEYPMPTNASWMLYGATGYTGTLIAKEAVRRGHRPLLAGRTEAKLRLLAERLNLNYVVVSLDDTPTLEEALSGVDLVLHAAGPYALTAEPMIQACLKTGTHYLDVSGEFEVFERVFSLDEAARERGIVLIPGVGFDVVASDCLAKYVADQVPNAVELEIAISALDQSSPGTTKTMLEVLSQNFRIRRDGEYVIVPFGEGVRQIRFAHRNLTVIPIIWPDLVTAYHTTGIPTITVYFAVSPKAIRQGRRTLPVVRPLLRITPLRRFLQKLIEKTVRGPSEAFRGESRCHVWARAVDAAGNAAEAWLETPEGYRLTAISSVNAVERILSSSYAGALTPAGAFGAAFVTEIQGTRRFDSLPEVR
jgi:short subunit dehydrogenase-like uncharacterized protein